MATASITMASTYGPDQLYEQLKIHPRRGDTVPPFLLEALPLQRLAEMANVKELSVLYWGEEKPETFYTHYSGGGKSLGVAVSVIRPDSRFSSQRIINDEKKHVRQEQNSAMPDWQITLVPLGDFGYLQINKHTPETLPPNTPPELRASLLVERADLFFIKGRVFFRIITYRGFLKPEQLVEVAKGFEQLLAD